MTAPTVFVVDDDMLMRKALGTLIRSAGLNVQVFSSAKEFLTQEPLEAPACLVLDVNLPDMSGMELQKRARPETQQHSNHFYYGARRHSHERARHESRRR